MRVAVSSVAVDCSNAIAFSRCTKGGSTTLCQGVGARLLELIGERNPTRFICPVDDPTMVSALNPTASNTFVGLFGLALTGETAAIFTGGHPLKKIKSFPCQEISLLIDRGVVERIGWTIGESVQVKEP